MVGMKKKVVGLETGKYNGISSMYNFRCDPDLGIGKAACRRIPCACMTCLELLETPWAKELDDQSQPRYKINEIVYVDEKKGGYGNDKTQASTDDRCDNNGDIRKKYST